ncbi:hypothetical protein GW17_00000543 [Ensete ventricosum]|nr:hypothetical protein GW17_00000543 [Ensete ventricosum]
MWDPHVRKRGPTDVLAEKENGYGTGGCRVLLFTFGTTAIHVNDPTRVHRIRRPQGTPTPWMTIYRPHRLLRARVARRIARVDCGHLTSRWWGRGDLPGVTLTRGREVTPSR